jgi:hypothetical protein
MIILMNQKISYRLVYLRENNLQEKTQFHCLYHYTTFYKKFIFTIMTIMSNKKSNFIFLIILINNFFLVK